MAIVIQIRRDIAANWTSVNPLLAQGEWGEELDTLKFKVGDGVLRWNALPYVIPSSDATTASNIGAGTGVFSSKAINDLQFKSLVGANGVTISSGVNTVTISGGGTAIYDHNALNNLDYASANHTGFASTVALTTTSGYILTYVSNNYIDNSEMATISGNIVYKIITTHSGLSGLSNDDHLQYSLVNGTRAFTNTVSGVYPTTDNHLSTKKYVDDNTIFGDGFNYATSAGVSVTTSDGFQTKLTLTTSTLVSGTYRIGVSYGWNYDSAADDFESRVLFDGGQIGATHNEEPSDSGGTSWSGTGTDQRHYISRTFYTTVTGSLTHTVTLEYRATVAGTSAGIWDAVIELWRVR
jgi:hypothetical protein